MRNMYNTENYQRRRKLDGDKSWFSSMRRLFAKPEGFVVDENTGWFSGNVQAMRTTNGGETVVILRIEL